MISKEMVKSLNKQINAEYFSAFLYLSMQAYAMDQGFKGVASWLYQQAKEEITHAEKITNYLFDQGEKVLLDTLEKPQVSFKSILEVFEAGLKHEKFVTASINKLVALADKEKDYATGIFLQWFVTEQVEEEGSFGEIIQYLKMIGSNNNPAMFMLDAKLAKRD